MGIWSHKELLMRYDSEIVWFKNKEKNSEKFSFKQIFWYPKLFLTQNLFEKNFLKLFYTLYYKCIYIYNNTLL